MERLSFVPSKSPIPLFTRLQRSLLRSQRAWPARRSTFASALQHFLLGSFEMFTMIMKSASVAALLLAVFLSPSANYLIGLQFVVCLAACVVFSQAVQSRKL